ncbi:hypothetical protein [Staphylococcus warneri]|uniref:hypothetical protein n=1 Tax=Staphylococcus warneri TaxID=1292 RepID=UPI003CEB56A8
MGGEIFMTSYYGLDPAVKKLLDNYRNQISYFNEIHKNRLNEVISIAKQVKHVPSYNSAVINAALNTTSFLNTDEYMQFKNGVLNTKKILDSANFQRNLFSEKVLNDFIKSTNFQKDEVKKVSNRLRQSLIDTVDVSSFSETVDSSHPVDGVNSDNYNSVFKDSLNHNVVSPSAKFVKSVSVGSATGVTTPVLIRTIFDQYVDYFAFSAVIATLLTCYLIANQFIEEDSEDQ